MKSAGMIFCLLASLFLLTSCSTPASRIKKNPNLFASFPSDVQEKIQKGEIDIGYTEDMVMIALGRPDRMYTRKTDTGEARVWSYVDFYMTSDRQRVNADVRVRDSTGIYQTVHDTIWVDVEQRNEYEKLRVEFENGKVKAIETLNR